MTCRYLQLPQLPELQDEHDALCFRTPFMPKVENFFETFSELHCGQMTAAAPNTSFSNSSPQAEQVYSKIGIGCSLQDRAYAPYTAPETARLLAFIIIP
jgi:hypothetical protein